MLNRGLLLCFSALLACGAPAYTVEHGAVRIARAANYTFAEPSWERVTTTDADATYIASSEACTLLVNSRCGTEFDIPLRALTQHLLIGFTEKHELASENLWTMQREALAVHTTGRLEGVPIEVWTHVWKIDSCVYDVVLTHQSLPTDVRPERPTESHMPQTCSQAQAQIVSTIR